MLVVKTTSPETCPSPANVQPEKDTPSSSTTNARLRPASGPTLRPCSKLCSQPIVHQLSTNYRAHDPRGQLPPEVGAVRGPTPECVLVHRPLIRQVNQREICRCSGRDTICPSPEPPPGRCGHRFNQPRERKLPALHQLRVQRREGRLVA